MSNIRDNSQYFASSYSITLLCMVLVGAVPGTEGCHLVHCWCVHTAGKALHSLKTGIAAVLSNCSHPQLLAQKYLINGERSSE